MRTSLFTGVRIKTQEAQLLLREQGVSSAGARTEGQWGQFFRGHQDMARAEARAYNGSLGAEPGPKAEPLVRESGGEAPQKMKAFLVLDFS